MTDLQDLLQRIEAAIGPDRNLDALLYVALYGGNTSREPSDFGLTFAPAYTASIDAVNTLIEDTLPAHYGYGWHKSSYKPEIGPQPTRIAAEIWHVAGDHTVFTIGQTDKSPALGLCIALLKALIAKDA